METHESYFERARALTRFMFVERVDCGVLVLMVGSAGFFFGGLLVWEILKWMR